MEDFNIDEMTVEEVRALTNEEYKALYEENEHYNFHIENILLDAKRFGTQNHVERAENLLHQYNKIGEITPSLYSIKYALYGEIWEKKHNKSFAEFMKR